MNRRWLAGEVPVPRWELLWMAVGLFVLTVVPDSWLPAWAWGLVLVVWVAGIVLAGRVAKWLDQ